MKEKSAAILTIKKASKMTKEGKTEVANWLRNCAEDLIENGSKYSKRYTARYLY